MPRESHRIMSDIHGHLDPATVEDSEIAVVLSNDARVGLLKLLGAQSWKALMGFGLTIDEANAVGVFRHRLD